MEELDYLIKYLLNESNQNIDIHIGKLEKKNLYRALVNIRQPKPISDEFLKVEDKYLQKELNKKEIINTYDRKSLDKICLIQGDITKLKIDAIVNAANSQGLGCFVPNHNCIDNQIQTFAGVRMRLECDQYMKTIDYNLKTSKCFITKGYNLPAKNVIHVVGPIIEYEVTLEKEKQLANCYKNCLELAEKNNIKMIAFPGISTGVFRFPKDRAAQIAVETVKEYLNSNDNFDKVVFVAYTDEDYNYYKELL